METVEHPAGTVAQEYQAGWLLGDRLLRPALVVVARPPRPAPVETPAAAGAEDAGAAPPAAEPEAPGDGSDAEGGGN
jgi:molecular chaperone GrpE